MPKPQAELAGAHAALAAQMAAGMVALLAAAVSQRGEGKEVSEPRLAIDKMAAALA